MPIPYSDGDACENLRQGDVLRRTPDLDRIIEQFHPHYFAKPDNKYFVVITQDCDLVRRDGSPPAGRYINLAPARPLELLVDRELASLREAAFAHISTVCTLKQQSRFRQFLERLLNNNQLGMFFLPKDPNRAFPQDCCALLELSIALRADYHYDTCLEAKVLELEASFRAKLGWLVGQSYSRIGTEDLPKAELDAKIRDISQNRSLWIDNRRLPQLHERAESWQNKNPGQLMDAKVLAALAKGMPKAKAMIASRVVELLLEKNLIDPTKERFVRNLINSDEGLSPWVRD